MNVNMSLTFGTIVQPKVRDRKRQKLHLIGLGEQLPGGGGHLL